MGIESDEEDAAFTATFTDTAYQAPEPQQPAAEPEQTPGASADEAQPEAKPANPLDALPPEVRELLEDIPRLRRELADTKAVANRVPHLQKQLDKLGKASAAPPPEKPKFEKLDAIRSELPEIADAIQEIADRISTREAPAPEPEPDEGPSEVEEAIAKLNRVRPSWQAEKGSAGFQGWLKSQPADYQRELNETADPVVFLAGLSRWDSWVAQQATRSTPQPSTTTQRRAAAVMPKGTSAASRPEPDDDEEAAMQAAFNNR